MVLLSDMYEVAVAEVKRGEEWVEYLETTITRGIDKNPLKQGKIKKSALGKKKQRAQKEFNPHNCLLTTIRKTSEDELQVDSQDHNNGSHAVLAKLRWSQEQSTHERK